MCLTRSKIHGWTWCPWPVGRLVYLACFLLILLHPQRALCECYNLFWLLQSRVRAWLLEGTHYLSVEMGMGVPMARLPDHLPSPVVYLSASLYCSVNWQRGWCQFLYCVSLSSLPVPHTTFCLVCALLLGVVLCWQIAGKHFYSMFKASGYLTVCPPLPIRQLLPPDPMSPPMSPDVPQVLIQWLGSLFTSTVNITRALFCFIEKFSNKHAKSLSSVTMGSAKELTIQKRRVVI